MAGRPSKEKKMKPPSSPNLLQVIRALLKKIELRSYPNNDPIAVENLKAHLRYRIAELEVDEQLKVSPRLRPERSPLLYREEWWLPWSQRSRALPLEDPQRKTDQFGTGQHNGLK